MTEKAKIPEMSTNLQSIDIYLFSNGQRFSPPRKYHLKNDQLRLWKATLMHLARLHYGSLHSHIELYTLEGHKVHDPLKLINGNAYVALEPPDLFIDSGYSKYMIKASRSWQKSQARKRNSNEISKPDECNNKILISNSDNHSNDFHIRAPNEKTVAEVVHRHAVDSINSTTKPVCSENTFVKKCMTFLKFTENNRLPCSQNPNNITKLYNSTLYSPKKKFLPTNKSHIPNSKQQNLQRNELVSSINKVPIIKKISSTPYKVKTPFSVSSKLKKGSTDSSKYPSNHKLNKSVNSNISSTNDVETEASIFKNTDNELPSMVVDLENKSDRDDTDETKNNNDAKKICDIFMPIFEEAVDDIKSNAIKEPMTIYSDDCKTKSKTFIESKQHESNVMFSGKNNEENCIIINKGDIINLKLHIEVQKEEDGTRTYNKLVKKSQSLTKICKDEKASQINLDGEQFIQKSIHIKPLHSLQVSELNNNVVGTEHSIVIVKYDCCVLLSQNVNRNLFVLLPTTKYSKQIHRCQCANEDNEEFETVCGNNEQAQSSSNSNPLKEAISDLSLERMISKEHEIIILLTDQEIPQGESKSNNSKDEQNELIIRKFDENKIENDNLKTKYFITRYPLENEAYEKPKSLIITKATEVFPKTTLNKSIQTEWSNILLQAIRQDDGHYTFHLPSLHLLKRYKIC